jgi:hypothetical protein
MALKIGGTSVIDDDKNLVNVGRIYTTVTNNQTSSKTIVNREFVSVTVGSGVTITLPASPETGNEVAIQVGNFNNTVIGRNTKKIMGLDEDLTIDRENVTVNLFYTDNTRGWRIV